MQNLTWNEYAEIRSNKEAFRLTHYSPLFHNAHCKAVIKGMDFILGWDDRYTNTLEWNNQVNQVNERHLGQYVEITPIVAEEIKQRLRDYQEDLVKAEAHLKTGLSGIAYNTAINDVAQAKKMIKIYSKHVELLPIFEDDVTEELNTRIETLESELAIETDFYKKRIISNNIEFSKRVLSNLPQKEMKIDNNPMEESTQMIIEHDTSIEINSIEELKTAYDCLIKQGYKAVMGETYEVIANDFIGGYDGKEPMYFVTYDDNEFMLCSHQGCETIHHITAESLKVTNNAK